MYTNITTNNGTAVRTIGSTAILSYHSYGCNAEGAKFCFAKDSTKKGYIMYSYRYRDVRYSRNNNSTILYTYLP